MLKLDLSKKNTGNFPEGWTECVINDAVDGDYNGSRYIDLFFKDQPESVKCRIWRVNNTKTGEEFGITNLFHHAWAGITVDEDTNTATIDDNARHLKGKRVNVLFYENEGGFTDAVGRIAPVVSEHFTESDVTALKKSAERYHARSNRSTTGTNGSTDTTVEEAVPF
jgi:hypothetical protein